MTLAIRFIVYVDDDTTQSLWVRPTMIDMMQKVEKFHSHYIHEFKKYNFDYKFPYEFKNAKYVMFCIDPELRRINDFQEYPDLVLTYGEGDEVDDHFIDVFIDFFKNPKEELPKELIGLKKNVNHPVDKPYQPFVYDYEEKYDRRLDILYCTITRNQSTDPFVVELFNFSEKGHEKLFYDLFAEPSWGLYKSDYDFLTDLWKELKLPGEFELNKLREKYDKATYEFPPDKPPTVYRVARSKPAFIE